MTETQKRDSSGIKLHWSFWLIGALAVLWNAMGGLNYIYQMDADKVALMPETYRVAIESRPVWATGAFAVAVFGGLLGSILLLLRKSAAQKVFVVACIAAIIAVVQFQTVAGTAAISALAGGLVQVAVAVFLIWYSGQARKWGWTN